MRHGFKPSCLLNKKGCTRLAAACDKVYQLLGHVRWFSLGTPASSTTKTGHHDIAGILLKVALTPKIKSVQYLLFSMYFLLKANELQFSFNAVRYSML
jgi:hypothetical protein